MRGLKKISNLKYLVFRRSLTKIFLQKLRAREKYQRQGHKALLGTSQKCSLHILPLQGARDQEGSKHWAPSCYSVSVLSSVGDFLRCGRVVSLKISVIQAYSLPPSHLLEGLEALAQMQLLGVCLMAELSQNG